MCFLKTTLKTFKVDETKVCLSVCLSVCASLASDSSESIEVIIIKLGLVTASDMVMHYVFIILTLTFIHFKVTDVNQEEMLDYFIKYTKGNNSAVTVGCLACSSFTLPSEIFNCEVPRH